MVTRRDGRIRVDAPDLPCLRQDVRDAAISSSRKPPGSLEGAIVEVRRTIRARDQFLESTDQRADYLASLVEHEAGVQHQDVLVERLRRILSERAPL